MRYLAYGSNLHPVRLQRRTPSATFVATRELAGWCLSFDKRGQDGSGKATITQTDCGGDRVWCAIYEIDSAEKPLLDRIEGLNRGYHEHRLDIPGLGEVWTYHAATDYRDHGSRPFRWYRDLVALGARFHRFPDAYVQTIECLLVEEDPDRRRSQEHDRLLVDMGGVAEQTDGSV